MDTLTILGGELAGATEPTAAGESPGATGPAAAVTSPGATEAATGSSGSTGSAAFPADPDRALVRALVEHRRTQVARLPSRKRVETFVDSAVSLLFPQHSAESRASEDQLLARITLLRAELASMLRAVLPRQRSDAVAEALTRALPAIYDRLRADAAAIVEGDPAAESLDEVIAAYPGFFAITVHRIAHELHRLGAPTLPRLLAEAAHARTGIDIHPGATVGHALCIDHGTGIVVGETAIIGDDVKLYQGVTLGALSVVKTAAGSKRHPTIEDRVVLYANATVLGGDTVVGHDSVIGGNVWLTTSVAPHSFVYHTSQIRVRSVADALGNSDYSI
jgi:serine O-acetyltransferase